MVFPLSLLHLSSFSGHSLLFPLGSPLPSLKFHSPTRECAENGCQVNRRLGLSGNHVLLEKAERSQLWGLWTAGWGDGEYAKDRFSSLWRWGRDLICTAFYWVVHILGHFCSNGMRSIALTQRSSLNLQPRYKTSKKSFLHTTFHLYLVVSKETWMHLKPSSDVCPFTQPSFALSTSKLCTPPSLQPMITLVFLCLVRHLSFFGVCSPSLKTSQ